MSIPKRVSVANNETEYVGVPIHGDAIGVHIAWLDATSDAGITLQTSNYSPDAAPVGEDGEAWQWVDESLSITGPGGTAAGAEMVHAENVRAKRARLKIEANADSEFKITESA